MIGVDPIFNNEQEQEIFIFTIGTIMSLRRMKTQAGGLWYIYIWNFRTDTCPLASVICTLTSPDRLPALFACADADTAFEVGDKDLSIADIP